jgi:GNAT superfamily N-acetyltransferase
LEDFDWVVSRHGAVYKEEFGWNQDFQGLVAGIVEDFKKGHDHARERAWIAHAHGQRLGCVFLVREDDQTAKLRILLVEPFARGAGIGSLLVAECLRFAKAAGYKRVTLWTNSVLVSARRIYEAAGFKLDKENEHESFGKKLTGQFWSKTL